jgi:hypothetical protein
MRKRTVIAAVVLSAALMPAPAFAWGFAGHRYIMGRAIELLPPPLKAFFDHYRDEIVVRAVDPDLWRNVGWEEDPNHFLDFGAREYGEYPFTVLPRELGAAVEKFGMATVKRNGTLPWRAQELFGNLRRTFEGFARGSQYGPSDLILFSAVAGHYIQDAHQPLHATINYDGQQTGNTGIHARFERDLIEKFQSRLTVKPSPPTAITNARDRAFETLLASYKLVDPILKADTEAIGRKDTYDDEYFEAFFTRVKPILEQRLGEAIGATAGLIVGAWETAGKPALALEGARPVEKVRKPGSIH